MSKERKGEGSRKIQNLNKPNNLNGVKKIKTPPDMELGGLKVWIHEYQFPDAVSYYDSNWLVATACCTGRESEIWINGAFLLTTDLDEWKYALTMFDFEPKKVLKLISMDNQLMLDLTITAEERLYVKVEISPGGNEEHFYYYDVEPSVTSKFIEDMKKVLARFPIRGK